MLILGIDPGTRILGYSLLETASGERRVESGERRVESGERRVESGERRVESGERTAALGYSSLSTLHSPLKVVAMDVLYLKQIADFNMRIRRIFDTTLRIIDGYHPDHLAIEAPFFGKNVQSMLKLGRAQGVAIAAAMSRDLSFTEYEPATIKQLVTGNGNASKEQVATMLRSILGFDDSPRYLDATDALAVAYTCHMQFSNPLADLREQLMPKRPRSKSAKKQWADFVTSNPDRVS